MAKANRPVRIGLVGLGFMGLTHLRAARSTRGARLVAVADSDPRRARGDFSRVKGNFGEAGAQEDFSALSTYGRLEDLLADDDVDLVDLCLPTHLHPAAVTRALRAGKHVLVEKPIALSPPDARRMLKARLASGRVLMVAQVLKFFPEFSALLDGVRKERWGRLLALHLRRVITRPSWSPDSWFADPNRSGGMIIDLHIHDTDLVVSQFGKPEAVTSHGLVEGEQVSSIRTVYHFESGEPLISSEAGWVNAPGLPFEHGYEAWFEKATIRFDSTTCPQPRVWGRRSARDLALPSGDGFGREIAAAVASVKNGEAHPWLAPETAAASLSVALAEKRSVLTGRKVRVR